MIVSFIFFLVMFLGGIGLLGMAHAFVGFEALAFGGGIILVSIALAWAMRERGGATRRANNWDGGPAAE